MFNNYLATSEDLKAVEEALKFVLHPKMRFVFNNPSKITKTIIISYDSKFIYVWKIKPINLTYKIPHKIKIKDEWQLGWRAGIEIAQVEDLLPVQVKNKSRFEIPIISGGLLTPFIGLQKPKKIQSNPYVTRESYLATIIHEFGHVYWNSFKLWWFSNKDENIKYLKIAQKLYDKKGLKDRKIRLNFPLPGALGEAFAFCTEYAASEIFWPSHKNNLDRFGKRRIDQLIVKEKKSNLDKENSVIEPTENPHDFSTVFGKIILEKYPTTWPKILTDQKNISLSHGLIV